MRQNTRTISTKTHTQMHSVQGKLLISKSQINSSWIYLPLRIFAPFDYLPLPAACRRQMKGATATGIRSQVERNAFNSASPHSENWRIRCEHSNLRGHRLWCALKRSMSTDRQQWIPSRSLSVWEPRIKRPQGGGRNVVTFRKTREFYFNLLVHPFNIISFIDMIKSFSYFQTVSHWHHVELFQIKYN